MTETTIVLPETNQDKSETNRDKSETNQDKSETNQDKSKNKLPKIRKIRKDKGREHLWKMKTETLVPKERENAKSFNEKESVSEKPKYRSMQSFYIIIVLFSVMLAIIIFYIKSKSMPQSTTSRGIFA